MNFITRHLNAIGLLALITFVATAAGMYFNLPVRLNKSSVPASATVIAANYACPMHPEVVANDPGHCSKCGMALTIATAAAETKTVQCQHEAASTDRSEVAVGGQAGCGHAEQTDAGGCCAKPPQPVATPLPGGCTRSLYPQTAISAE